MLNYLEQLSEDLDNFDIPENFEVAYEKIKCELNVGDTIYWYYKQDLEFFNPENPRDYACDLFRGIVIPRFGISMTSPNMELNVEDVVIVIVSTPSEKDYPDSDWVSLKRLLNDGDLIEMFSEEN